MQQLSSILKFLIRLTSPSIIFMLLIILSGSLGVFMEEEPLLMLKGGFNNIYVSFSFFILSLIITWVICLYAINYSRIFRGKLTYLLLPIFSTTLTITLMFIYYILLFYYLTGLVMFDVDFIVSKTLEKSIATTLLSVIICTVIFFFIGNLLGIYYSRKKPKIKSEKSSNIEKTNGEQITSSNFEDSISI